MLNAAKASLLLAEICSFSKSWLHPFFYLNVMNSRCLKPDVGFLTPVYPIVSETRQIFVPPVFWIPISWPWWQDFRNAACLQLPVTLMRIACSAALKIQSLCSKKKKDASKIKIEKPG